MTTDDDRTFDVFLEEVVQGPPGDVDGLIARLRISLKRWERRRRTVRRLAAAAIVAVLAIGAAVIWRANDHPVVPPRYTTDEIRRVDDLVTRLLTPFEQLDPTDEAQMKRVFGSEDIASAMLIENDPLGELLVDRLVGRLSSALPDDIRYRIVRVLICGESPSIRAALERQLDQKPWADDVDLWLAAAEIGVPSALDRMRELVAEDPPKPQNSDAAAFLFLEERDPEAKRMLEYLTSPDRRQNLAVGQRLVAAAALFEADQGSLWREVFAAVTTEVETALERGDPTSAKTIVFLVERAARIVSSPNPERISRFERRAALESASRSAAMQSADDIRRILDRSKFPTPFRRR